LPLRYGHFIYKKLGYSPQSHVYIYMCYIKGKVCLQFVIFFI